MLIYGYFGICEWFGSILTYFCVPLIVLVAVFRDFAWRCQNFEFFGRIFCPLGADFYPFLSIFDQFWWFLCYFGVIFGIFDAISVLFSFFQAFQWYFDRFSCTLQLFCRLLNDFLVYFRWHCCIFELLGTASTHFCVILRFSRHFPVISIIFDAFSSDFAQNWSFLHWFYRLFITLEALWVIFDGFFHTFIGFITIFAPVFGHFHRFFAVFSDFCHFFLQCLSIFSIFAAPSVFFDAF